MFVAPTLRRLFFPFFLFFCSFLPFVAFLSVFYADNTLTQQGSGNVAGTVASDVVNLAGLTVQTQTIGAVTTESSQVRSFHAFLDDYIFSPIISLQSVQWRSISWNFRIR